MALLRRLFYRKPPDHLLEISERIYVFDRCFSADLFDESAYNEYICDTISELQGYHRDASLMLFNFKEGQKGHQVSDILSHYGTTVMEYPRQYENCPILPLEMIYHFLVSSERWLSFGGSKQNILLMHCEKGGWPILAFMLSALLLFRKQYNGEKMTLEMIYMQAPKDLLENLLPLDSKPSQIRYLQYLSRKKPGFSGSLVNTPLFIDCLILNVLPPFDARGCKLVVRIYGQDPLNESSTNTRLLFSSSKIKEHIQNCYKVDLVKIDIHRRVRGDVVLECIRLFNNMEEMLFHVMFNTTFVLSSTLFFTRDDVDIPWDAKNQFPKEFEAEVHFIDINTVPSDISRNVESEDENDSEVSSIDEFFEVDEIFLDRASDVETQTHGTQVELSSNMTKDIALDLLIQPKAEVFKDIVVDDGNRSVFKSEYDTSVVKDIVLDEGAQNQEKSLEVETFVTKMRDNDLDAQEDDVDSFTWNADSPRGKKRKLMIPEKVVSTGNTKPKCGRLSNEMLASDVELFENRTNTQILQGEDGKPMSLAFVCSRNQEEEWNEGFNQDCSSKVVEKSKEVVQICLPPLPPPLPDVARQSPLGLSTSNEGLPLSPGLLSVAQDPRPPLSPLSNGQCPPPPPAPPPSNGPCLPPPPPPPPPAPPPSNGPCPPPFVGHGLPPPPPPIFVGRRPPPPPPPPFVGQDPPPPAPFGGQGPPPPPIFGCQVPPPPPPSNGGTPGPPAPPRPPGVSAPPPPPGDLKGGMGRGHLTRSTSLAIGGRKQSLKPLHWSKVTRVMQGSLWEELQKQARSQSEPDIDVIEIENLFSAAVKKQSGMSGGKKKSTPKSETVHLVDLRRANNTEIMLTKVKMPLPDMMVAALSLDESVLDGDQVENLIKFCPNKDEMELLQNYPGDKEKLGKCEQFLLELMKVPRVESKLEVFLFKIQFNSQIADFKRSLDLVNSASDEVRNSSKLKEVMRIILALGNTLNNGTVRGGAFGFKLDSLLKLNETRATNSRMTLMHYLGKVLAKKYPHLLDFHEDFVTLEAATKINLKALAEEMQSITKGLDQVNKELIESENDGPISEDFCKNVKEFIGSCEDEVGSLMDLYSVVGKNSDALAMYFGEDPNRCPFEEVTQTLLNFVKTFRNAHEENMKKAKLDRKKAEKEAELAKCSTPKGKESDTPKEKELDTPKWKELESAMGVDLDTPKSMNCDTPTGVEEET